MLCSASQSLWDVSKTICLTHCFQDNLQSKFYISTYYIETELHYGKWSYFEPDKIIDFFIFFKNFLFIFFAKQLQMFW